MRWVQLCSSLSILWHFFGIGMKTDLFQSCGHCWVFQICWQTECSTFTASSFRIWNSSTGIPSPPLALFVAMLPKTHLTSHSRMSGSRWVVTPSWLSGLWDLFCITRLCTPEMVLSQCTWKPSGWGRRWLRCMAHLDSTLTKHLVTWAARNWEGHKMHTQPSLSSCRLPENLSGLALGSAQNSRPALDSGPAEHPLAWVL